MEGNRISKNGLCTSNFFQRESKRERKERKQQQQTIKRTPFPFFPCNSLKIAAASGLAMMREKRVFSVFFSLFCVVFVVGFFPFIKLSLFFLSLSFSLSSASFFPCVFSVLEN